MWHRAKPRTLLSTNICSTLRSSFSRSHRLFDLHHSPEPLFGAVLSFWSTVCAYSTSRYLVPRWRPLWQSKINGLTLPRKIRSSAFTKHKDIEQLRSTGFADLPCCTKAPPTATVFLPDLLKHIKSKGIDIDQLATQKALSDKKTLDKSQAGPLTILPNVLQSWQPTVQADPAAQRFHWDLECAQIGREVKLLLKGGDLSLKRLNLMSPNR